MMDGPAVMDSPSEFWFMGFLQQGLSCPRDNTLPAAGLWAECLLRDNTLITQ
uniref:Alternative protein LOC100134423 n=1 Tax=Homo sapiens TaxID=9606 RepID=L8EAW0_HUMAN|nr:GC1732 [Homo sapiens]CCQ43966.1 alternative protein LOC100134423 [Homo sapiens]